MSAQRRPSGGRGVGQPPKISTTSKGGRDQGEVSGPSQPPRTSMCVRACVASAPTPLTARVHWHSVCTYSLLSKVRAGRQDSGSHSSKQL